MRRSAFHTTSTALSGVLSIGMGAVLLGTVGIASTLLGHIQAIPPLTIAFLRASISLPFLWLLAWSSTRSSSVKMNWRDLPLFAMMGLAMASCHALFFLAIPFSSVTLAVVVSLCSAPLLVALLSTWLFHERMGVYTLVSLLLALIGIGLLTLGGESSLRDVFKSAYLLGVLLALGSGCSYAIFMLLSKVAARRAHVSSSQVVAWTFSIAACCLFVVAVLSGNLRLNLSLPAWTVATYLGIVPTGLTYFLIQRGLQSVSATVASVITLLEPVIAAILAWTVLGEHLTLFAGLGAGLLLLSVVLLSSSGKQA